jgi:hypothetical protein
VKTRPPAKRRPRNPDEASVIVHSTDYEEGWVTHGWRFLNGYLIELGSAWGRTYPPALVPPFVPPRREKTE